MSIQTLLVTGNLGYIGSTLVPILTESGYDVIGYDIGYYEDCYLKPSPQKLVKQIKKDIRDVSVEDLRDIDCVLHLAGLSNDPLGELNPDLTDEINFKSTVRLAEAAKKAGVKRFIYTSSQSIYGISDVSKEADEDSTKNPLTAYAISKWNSECALREMCTDNFIIAYLRPATAYGASPNLREDIVFNAFTAYAYTAKNIEIRSDGTPWRPMTHIRDIAAAFIACIQAPEELINNQAFNVGTDNNNYQVKDLAIAAQQKVEGTQLKFTGEDVDSRSYRVSSKKILRVLENYYKPIWNIDKGADELLSFYDEVDFDKETFQSYKCNRLKCLKKLLDEKKIDGDLRMV